MTRTMLSVVVALLILNSFPGSGATQSNSNPFVRRYKDGEALSYHMKASNQGRNQTIRYEADDCVPEPYSVIFSICRWTGLRRSEVLGLKWSDYEGSQIQIRRSLGFGLKGEMVLSAPKTEKSQAPVHVVPELRLVMNRWKQSQGKKLDRDIIGDCWIFQASESRSRRDDKEHGDLFDAAGMPPMNPANILRVVLPKLEKAGIEWKGWHGFRRGVATELHREGVQDIVIQRALRHSNIAVTQESYIKDVPEVVSDALEKLAKSKMVGRA